MDEKELPERNSEAAIGASLETHVSVETPGRPVDAVRPWAGSPLFLKVTVAVVVSFIVVFAIREGQGELGNPGGPFVPPEPFTICHPTSPDSSGYVPKHPTRNVANPVAEALFVRGAALSDQGKSQEAINLFRQAQLMVPTDPRFPAAVERIERSLAAKAEFASLEASSIAMEPRVVAQKIEKRAKEDPDFFFTNATSFAMFLERHGMIASSVAVLQTFCRKRPAHRQARADLERLLGVLQAGRNPATP